MQKKIKATTNFHLSQLIKNEIALHGNECSLNHIDTSQWNVVNMNNLFLYCKN